MFSNSYVDFELFENISERYGNVQEVHEVKELVQRFNKFFLAVQNKLDECGKDGLRYVNFRGEVEELEWMLSVYFEWQH